MYSQFMMHGQKNIQSNLYTLYSASLLKMCEYKQFSCYVLLDTVIRFSVCVFF